MNNPLKKIKFKILKDYTTDDVFRETQKNYDEKIRGFDEKIRGLSDRIDQLSRIIEHTSGNTVNFYLDWSWVNTFYMLSDKKVYTLHIYKGASETPIILKELSDGSVDEESCMFALEDNIARFEVTVKRVSMDVYMKECLKERRKNTEEGYSTAGIAKLCPCGWQYAIHVL